MTIRAPRIRRKQPITAAYLNTLADRIDDLGAGARAPQGLPSDDLQLNGEPVNLGVVVILKEIFRETDEVRVENPEDSEQYVIVERIKTAVFQDQTGRAYIMELSN